MANFDFRVTNHYSFYTLTPLTTRGEQWIEEHISEEALTLGNSIIVEHRYIERICVGILDDGLNIEKEGRRLYVNPEGEVCMRAA